MPEERRCPQCGARSVASAVSCSLCGQRFSEPRAEAQPSQGESPEAQAGVSSSPGRQTSVKSAVDWTVIVGVVAGLLGVVVAIISVAFSHWGETRDFHGGGIVASYTYAQRPVEQGTWGLVPHSLVLMRSDVAVNVAGVALGAVFLAGGLALVFRRRAGGILTALGSFAQAAFCWAAIYRWSHPWTGQEEIPLIGTVSYTTDLAASGWPSAGALGLASTVWLGLSVVGGVAAASRWSGAGATPGRR